MKNQDRLLGLLAFASEILLFLHLEHRTGVYTDEQNRLMIGVFAILAYTGTYLFTEYDEIHYYFLDRIFNEFIRLIGGCFVTLGAFISLCLLKWTHSLLEVQMPVKGFVLLMLLVIVGSAYMIEVIKTYNRHQKRIKQELIL